MWLPRNVIFLALIVLQISNNCWSLSDKRLCADPKCQNIISLAKSTLTYTAAEEGMVSFKINSLIRVKSKSAGSDLRLWGIEVNGRQGYAPKEFIMEQKIFIKEKDLTYEVPVVLPGAASVDTPAVSLSPSEAVSEEKIKTEEVTTTSPLASNENLSNAVPSLLNASESEVEATTAPLTDELSTEASKIVSQSLRETVTPVLEKVEVIDGTPIPIVNDMPSVAVQNPEQNQNSDIKTNEEATPKLETTTTAPIIEEATKTTEADKPIEANEPQIDKTTKPNPEIIESNVPKPNEITGNTKNEENENSIDQQSKVEKTTEEAKLSDDVLDTKEGNQNTPELVDGVKDKETTKESNTTPEVQKDTPILLNVPNPEKEDVKVDEKVESSQENVPNPNALPKEEEELVAKIDLDKEKGYSANSYRAYEEFDEDDEEEEEEDDEEDDSDIDDYPQSSSVELTTPETPEVTDSGFTTVPNVNYWEEEVPTTTPVPHIVEELKKTNESDDNTVQQKLPPTDQLTNEAIKIEPVSAPTVGATEFTTQIPVVTEAADTTTNSLPNVPTLPTTLPLFQQSNIVAPQTDQVLEQVVPYDNPNDYYQKQSLDKQENNLSDASQTAAPTTERHISTSAEELVTAKDPNLSHVTELMDTSTERYDSTSAEEVDYDTKQSEPASKDEYLHGGIDKFFAERTAEGNVPSIGDVSEKTPEPLDYSTGTIVTETTPSVPVPDHTVDSHKPLPKEEKRDDGLFTTILGTVNTFVNKLRKDPQVGSHEPRNDDDELNRILYPDRFNDNNNAQSGDQYCEKLSPHHCPQQQMSTASSGAQHCHYDWANLNADNFVEVFATKVFEMRELLSCLAIAGITTLLFLFGYYCFCNSSREGALISKLNLLERSLLASHKENAILKDDLHKTRNKLTSIEDNSFGSNDMVMSVKKELDAAAEEKLQLQNQVHSLEKELETAAEAGLELNKIVAELLNNQTGQESMIMNSVEDLQLQFNEQQKTILEINTNLAEKSRENSELQLMLAEQDVRLNGELASLQQDNDELEAEKANLQSRLEEIKAEFEEDITKALEGKNVEIKRLQNEIIELKNRYEDMHTKWQTGLAKIEALEECMKTIKRDPSVNVNDIINVANVRAELLDLQQQRTSLKNRLDAELETRQHAENSLQNAIGEVDKLKQDFHQSEKDKLEAQTRLEVLSNYFKEKETQLQKELSLKEAVWLKQQGENTSTVDRLTTMQEEIQSLKSQNDALRAEIEAQLAAHKAQTGTLENRAHETWLAARQSERRYEESRAEAAALRRRLTELAGATSAGDGSRALDGKITTGELNNAPSPILPSGLLDNSAGSPLLGRLPPPLAQFMPFMGPPPPPFLNLPPPPFLSSVEMRPAPLGRMMSPQLGRYSPGPQRDRERGRDRKRDNYYDDEYDYDDDDDDVDDDDYEYDDDEDAPRQRRQRRRSGNGSDNWRRDNYSPPPAERSYRSQSPDSRYNYTGDRDLMSTYDTETDLSPPPSPHERRLHSGGGSRTGSYHAFSPTAANTSPYITKDSTTGGRRNGKGSDSEKSFNSAHHKKKGKSSMV